ncbi:MAG: pyridoxal phosphate-dependent aminotransferase, partial [Chloroflexi bacterium]|nr:pyridoxal phosphate-dependent aminotransferase [Chloroflexota bacterium]
MTLSTLAKAIAQSPTLKLNEEAQKLRERGEAVINMGVGEPKNKAPIAAILGGAARLSGGDIKYSPTDGIPSLKKAILRYTEENYDKIVSPDNVIVSSGAKQAIFNALYAILNPQDEVIILVPYWVSYPEMIKMCYGLPVVVTPEDGRFQPTIQEIEEVVSSRTKAIILNSPNNPSGAVFTPELVSQIVELCERKNIYIITDDIYHKLVFNSKVAATALKYAKKDFENGNIIVINGIAKLYGMTGFRIGWAVAPKEMVQVMTNIQVQTTSCVSVVLQAAAEGALNGLQSTVEALRLTIQNNRDVMYQELKAFDGVKVAKPDGTFYIFPDFRAYNKNSVELASYLLKKALVVVVPGREFGLEGHVRLSYTGSIKDITDSVARMKWALDPNSPNEIYIGDRKL